MEHDLLLVRETLVHDVMREQPNFDPREHTSLALQAFRRIVEQLEALRGTVLGYRSTIAGLRDDAFDLNVSDEEFRELFLEAYPPREPHS